MQAQFGNAEKSLIILQGDGVQVVLEPHLPGWDEAAKVATAYEPPPVADPLETERAGMVASRFQTRAALYLAGLLPQVEAMIGKADPLTQMAWAEAVEFRRSSPTIAALAAGLGLDAQTLDALFRTAAGIEV